jgi:alpha-1,3-rhamnosyltransferase
VDDAVVELIQESSAWRARPVEVSATLITYNQERLVADALHSVLAQHWPMDLVISDDGSRDRTVEVMRAVLQASSSLHRIRLRRGRRNLGICRNQNAAVGLTEGELVVMFEGDDTSVPDRVEKLVARYLELGRTVGALGSGITRVDVNGRVLDEVKWARLRADAWVLVNGGWTVHGCGLAFRRDCFFDIGPISYHLVSGDIALWMRAAFLRGGGLAQIPESLVCYRSHGQNVGASYFLDYASPARLREVCRRLLKNEVAQVLEARKIGRYRCAGPIEPETDEAWRRLRDVSVARAALVLAVARHSRPRWIASAVRASRFRTLRPLARRVAIVAAIPWAYRAGRALIRLLRRRSAAPGA